MSLKCSIGFHTWNGCRCAICGKTRDEGHDWSKDCRECARCGKTRDERHDWSKDCEKCSRCAKVRPDRHQWDDCRCSMCGKIRDKGHDWSMDCEKCAKCGKAGQPAHTWKDRKCTTCGKAQDVKVIDIGRGMTLSLVRIEPGRFRMKEVGDINVGSPEDVRIRLAFYLGVTQVTQKQWQAVMVTNPSSFRGDDLPVDNVSWNDVVAFCAKLSEKSGLRFRLPSEAEWEYACRAGDTGVYAGTSKLDDVAWYEENSGGRPHPVGQKIPNAWGLFDMLGNVEEWCEDRFQGYEKDDRMMRGGSWQTSKRDCLEGWRTRGYPAHRMVGVGCRVAATCRSRGSI